MIEEELKYRLSFLDYKSLVEFVKVKYNFDLSLYAYSITKRRIEDFLSQYKVADYHSIISVLEKEKIRIPFLESILVPTTEMFRDYEFWQKLRDKLIPKLKLKSDLKIWVPEITSDDELMTLLIILKESGFENNYEILTTSPLEKEFEKIDFGMDYKKYEISKANYDLYNPHGNFDIYYTNSGKQRLLRKDLLINVKYKKYSFTEGFMQDSYFDMVLFRNRLIYFNLKGQKKALDVIYKSLKSKGYIFLGLKEMFGDWVNKDRFSKYEKDCNIFIKKK